jgi:hypothetical protein
MVATNKISNVHWAQKSILPECRKLCTEIIRALTRWSRAAACKSKRGPTMVDLRSDLQSSKYQQAQERGRRLTFGLHQTSIPVAFASRRFPNHDSAQSSMNTVGTTLNHRVRAMERPVMHHLGLQGTGRAPPSRSKLTSRANSPR